MSQNQNQEYLNYIDEKAPKSPLLKDMVMAFLFGGAICTIGQAIGIYTPISATWIPRTPRLPSA